jgi:hypothetical protein
VSAAEAEDGAQPFVARTVMMPGGEVLDLSPLLDQAVDLAIDALQTTVPTGDTTADIQRAREVFAEAFVPALFERGLLLVPRVRSISREAVTVDTYSLVCAGKHAAERTLGTIRTLAAGPVTLLDDLAEGVAALAGRAHPSNKARVYSAARRIHQILIVLAGRPLADADADADQVAGRVDTAMGPEPSEAPALPGEGDAA